VSPFERSRRQKRRNFGESWWGNAWVEAVEQHAEVNQSRLARGRAYARFNYVGALHVEPGVVRARVAGSRATPYHTHVKVAMLSDAEWHAFLDVVSGKVAHAAALIDSELTSELVEDAREAGINLLPAPGDLSTGCSCPDDAEPCKHAAAMCYLIADLLDDDPFELLHMRGRTKAQIITALRDRRRRPPEVASPSSPSGNLETEEAKMVFAATPGALPHVPTAPEHPGTPPAVTDIPEEAGVHATDLDMLARATVQRAWEICSGFGDSGLRDSPYNDLVRRLAPLLDTAEFDAVCSRTKRIRFTVEQDARRFVASRDPQVSEQDDD
jgi:uncharacterized Zn finger protein